MPRPAAEVRRVIKAYDVRGLVGAEIDEGFVADVGAAFARMLRDEDRGAGAEANSVVIGYDMRESSPMLAAAFAAGVNSQGLDRSAVLRLRNARLRRCDVHRQPQPGVL